MAGSWETCFSGISDVIRVESYHSLKSPACSCVSITSPAKSKNANHKMMRAAENLPFTRQFELAALLLSWRAVLDCLLRGLVNFLWGDQYRCSWLHGPPGLA